uniref:Protein phosphatase 2c/pyruvate dehydrogenase lipoamide phosphatase n=1 Tax=Xenopsylla cheopis TaxID=163159 RepID=A0A6M2DGE6_XENCH
MPKLSPHDVNEILRANEYTHEFQNGSVKSYDSNQLASNNPIEDTRSEGNCLLTEGLLVGVFDGHGGAGCAQVIGKRLLQYVAACLVPPELLGANVSRNNLDTALLNSYNDKVQFVNDIRSIYRDSLSRFIDDLVMHSRANDFKTSPGDYGEGKHFNMTKALETAFMRLDADISYEALNLPSPRTLSVAMSGAVACVAHVDGPHLHVANVGDAGAVLGVQTESGDWIAKKLSSEHNADNVSEVRRLLGEHPSNERHTVIRQERLLGQLAPLRALGDFRYKWPKEHILNCVDASLRGNILPPNYITPPYLTARPEVIHHRLTPRDRFLVIASDGLWDTMTPHQAVKLVGEHMFGKAFLSPLKLPKKPMSLGTIAKLLAHRRKGLMSKPLDRNAATHLIRNALGGTEYGLEHTKISHYLSLPQDIVRLFRDDITITVVYFDTEFLRVCPP